MNTHTLVYDALIFSGKIGPIGGGNNSRSSAANSVGEVLCAQVVAERYVRLTTRTIEIPTSNCLIEASVAKLKNGCILEPLFQELVPTLITEL